MVTQDQEQRGRSRTAIQLRDMARDVCELMALDVDWAGKATERNTGGRVLFV
jgi:hypothetical protein